VVELLEKTSDLVWGPPMLLLLWLWVIAVYIGAVLPLPVVWAAADVTNALMAIPNLLALLLLSGVVVRETRRYLWEGRLDEAAGPD
jgi:alanine or glycine:cation symporter, AGCS family